MEYTILILLLPVLSFLVLALAGMKMSHRVAGLIGSLSLGAVAVLSYVTAYGYFTLPRLADGTFETLIPYNFVWLPFAAGLHIDMGILLDPIFGDDAGGYFHRFAHGAHLFFRVYERGEGFSALLRFPELVHLFDARAGGSHEHFPDVCVLGIGRRVLLPAHRVLLYKA